MAELIRLELSGIRKFKMDDNPQIIDFAPVTLIRGENGTGKSTIIESLKFFTLNTNSVKDLVSSIKSNKTDKINSRLYMKFKNAANKTYELTFCPTVQNIDNKPTLSKGNCQYTCSDTTFDNLKPTDFNKISDFFGVSSSLIDNVLFCDQRKVSWPIDDTSTELKTKFDQIFNIEVYNKALSLLNKTGTELEKCSNDPELIKLEQKYEDYIKHLTNKQENDKKLKELLDEHNTINEIYQQDISIKDKYEKIEPAIKKLEKEIDLTQAKLEVKKENLSKSYENIEELLQIPFEYVINHLDELEKVTPISGMIEEQNKKKEEIENDIKSVKEGIGKIENLGLMIKSFFDKYGNNDYGSQLKLLESQMNEEEENLKKIQSKSENLMKKKDEFLQFEKQLKDFDDVDESKVQEAESNKNLAENKLREIKQSEEFKCPHDFDTKVSQKNKEIQELQNNISCYESMKNDCKENDRKIAKLTEAKSNIKSAQETIENELDVIKKTLKNDSIKSEEVVKIFSEKVNELNDQKKRSEKDQTQLQIEIEKIKDKIERTSNSLKQNDEIVRNAREKIEEVFKSDINNYDFEGQEAKKKLEIEKEKLARLESNHKVYIDFKDEASKCDRNGRHSCPLCHREFQSNSNYNDFVKDCIDDYISNLPNLIRACKENLEKCRDECNKLEGIRDTVKVYKDNVNNSSEFKREIQKLNDQLKNLTEKENFIISQIKSQEDELKMINELNKNIINLTNAQQIIQKNSIDLNLTINQNLPTFDDLIDKISSTNGEINKINQEITQLKDAKTSFIKQIEFLNGLISTFSDIKAKYDSKMDLISNMNQIKENEGDIDTLNSLIKTIGNSISSQTQVFKKSQNEYFECKVIVEGINGTDQSKLTDFQNELNLKEEELKAVKQNIADLEAKEKELEDEKQKMMSIKDYLSIQNDLNSYQNSKDELLRDFKSVNFDILSQDINKNFKKLTEIDAQIKCITSNNQQEENELKKNSSVPKLLTERRINHKLTENAIVDIERYTKMMDETIKNYHKEKLKEINNAIHFLWTKTYNGCDIESIKIGCEKENGQKKLMSYCVYAKVKGQKIEAKNFMSTGTIILASTIIRFALAQIFAPNCRIMALDEPTVHLDNGHIGNLVSLIVEMTNNKKIKPFQFIIISHEQYFVDLLYQNELVNRSYLIKKVIKEGKETSVIEKKD